MTKKKIHHSLVIIAFVIYIFAVFYITIFSREPEERRFTFDLFSSYVYWFKDHNIFYKDMIVLNIFMLMPFGFLFPLVNKKMNSFFKIFISGFLFSLLIESIQFISGRGLFELDDLFNNTLGACIGYELLIMFVKFFRL